MDAGAVLSAARFTVGCDVGCAGQLSGSAGRGAQL
jgi:hypothetical protein